ncbi:MAG: fibronectin type III domain-containing protein [Eubacterium sp.]
MKRTLSVLLSVLMLASTFTCIDLSAFAGECEHEYFLTSTVNVTCGNDGTKTYVCELCGDTKTEITAKATGKHKFIGSKCSVCGYKVPGFYGNAQELEFDTEYQFTFNSADDRGVFKCKFDGYADFVCTTDYPTECCAYNGSNDIIKSARVFKKDNNRPYTISYYTTVYYVLSSVEGDNVSYPYTVSFKLTQHEHNPTVSRTYPSTCKENGYERYSCSCGESYDVALPLDPDNHLLNSFKKCVYCGKDFYDGQFAYENDINIVYQGNKDENRIYKFIANDSGSYLMDFALISAEYNIDVLNYKSEAVKTVFFNKTIDGVKHKYIYTDDLVAGKAYYLKLSGFNADITDDTNTFIISQHIHDYALRGSSEPTCKREGSKTYYCSECNMSKTEKIPATGEHIYVDGKCKYCDLINQDQIIIAEINLNEKKVITTELEGAYCYLHFTPEQNGYYCFKTELNGENMKINSYGKVYVAETNTYVGSVSGMDAVNLTAGVQYEIRYNVHFASGEFCVTALNHEHSLCLYNIKYPNCVNNGCITYSCEMCNYKETVDTPAQADQHNFVDNKCQYSNINESDYVIDYKDIELNIPMIDISEYGNKKAYYRINIEEDGYYQIDFTLPDDGFEVNAYDSSMNLINGIIGSGKTYSMLVRFNKGVNYIYVNVYYLGEFSTVVTKHEHTLNSYKTVAPNCDKVGYTIYGCNDYRCDYSCKKDYVEATGDHIYEEAVLAPTCSSDGATFYTCKNCGIGYISDYAPINPNAHRYVDGICEECGIASVPENIEVLRLNENKAITLNSKKDIKMYSYTPYEDGFYSFYTTGSYDTYGCLYDEDFYYLNDDYDISSSNYNFRIYQYLEKGKTYYIQVSAEEYKANMSFGLVVAKHSHTYTKRVVNPTCGTCGYDKYVCACGDSKAMNYIPATGKHSMVKDTEVKPTCVEEGYTLYYCKNCNIEEKRDIVPATNTHIYEDNYCIYCDKQEKEINELPCGSINIGDVKEIACDDIITRYTYEFIPQEDSTCVISSTGITDAYAFLYDADGKLLAEGDDEILECNFQIVYNFKAGEKYIIKVGSLNLSRSNSFKLYIKQHIHEFSEVKVPATCGTEGCTLYTCTICNYSYIDDVVQPSGNHSSNDDFICRTCGCINREYPVESLMLFTPAVVEPLNEGIFKFVPDKSQEYSFISSGVTTPDCFILDEYGYILLDCVYGNNINNFVLTASLKAGETYYLVTSAQTSSYYVAVSTKHEHNYQTVSKVPASTSPYNGKINVTSKCALCNDIKVETLECTEHDYELIRTDANCYHDGDATYQCKICKINKTERMPKYEHNYVTNGTPATCTKMGYTVCECTRCGNVLYKSYQPELSHDFKYYVTKKATTTSNGKMVLKCSRCGEISKTVTINAIGSVTISMKSCVYNGKSRKPTVSVTNSVGNMINSNYYTVTYSNNKNVGKAKVTVKFKDRYSGTKTLYFTIKPKATSISSVSAKSKGFTVKWKKQTTQTTGYQIQYSTSSKFTNAKTVTVSKNSTTSKTVSKLKAKKKYYVRVRTYKTVNGTKYYSAWSKYKAVTTKK